MCVTLAAASRQRRSSGSILLKALQDMTRSFLNGPRGCRTSPDLLRASKLDCWRSRVKSDRPVAAELVLDLGHAASRPQHFLYFLPLPQGQSSLRPTLGLSRTIVLTPAATSPDDS